LKITNCVYWYKSDSSSCNSYLILNDDFGVLIDPGTTLRHRPKKILNEMRKDGLNQNKIEKLWLTHCHPDHSQAAKFWATLLNLKIFCHPETKKILTAKDPLVALFDRETKAAGNYQKELASGFDLFIINIVSEFIYGKWEPLKIEECFKEDDLIEFGIRIFFPASHSPDDVCFWLEKDKIIITGDLFDPHRKNPYAPVLNLPSANLNQCLKATKRIIELEPEILLPGHGRPIIGKQKILDYLQKILQTMQVYKSKTLEYLKQNPQIKFSEIGQKLETRKNISANIFTSHSTFSILGFIILKALKEDGSCQLI